MLPVGWFAHHIYLAVFLATFIEGLGLPLPAELLFVAAGVAAEQHHATLPAIVIMATLGNTSGSTFGFFVAFIGGKDLIRRVFRVIGVKEQNVTRVEEFFNKYGPGTVFLSRFVGFIRAATIYTAGVAQMAPWRFILYLGAGSLIWNVVWVTVAYRFGTALPHIMHRLLGRWAVWAVTLLALVLAGRYIWTWYRRRSATD